MTENGKALLTLTTKYGKICMYGGIITKLNPLTFHHCFKLKRDGGTATEYNGSSATRLMHSGIHVISEDDRKWDKYIKEYIREYKSYLKPEMTCEEFVALKVIQEMRAECGKDIDKRIHEMGYEEFLTKDKQMQLRKVRRYK